MRGSILRPVPVLCPGDLRLRVFKKKGRKKGQRKKDDDAYLQRLIISAQCAVKLMKEVRYQCAFPDWQSCLLVLCSAKNAAKCNLNFFPRLWWPRPEWLFAGHLQILLRKLHCALSFSFNNVACLSGILSCSHGKLDTGNLSPHLLNSRKFCVPLLY